jgi:uncharacterized protein involved in exopolysaccharide biosynthesis
MLRPAELVALLWRHRGLVVAAAFATAVLLASVALISPRLWESRSAFTTFQSSTGSGGVSGLAQQLGVQLPQGSEGGTPLFYSVLVRSRGLIRALVANAPPQSVLDGRRDLGAALAVSDKLAGDARREATVDAVLKAMSVDLNRESGIVSVAIRTPSARLSLWLNQSLLTLIDTYYGAIRRTRAGAERKFSEEQRVKALRDVTAAENAIEEFLTTNKQYRGSPMLETHFDRLSRQLTLKQSVYSALEQAFQKARLDEVRDTPAISVVETPVQPSKPAPRFLALRVLFGLVIGTVLAALALILRALLAPVFRAPAAELSATDHRTSTSG